MNDKLMEQIAKYNRMFKERDVLYRKVAYKAGISESSFWILFLIYESDAPLSQAEICREWNYSKQTINSAIMKLVKQGILQLIPDKSAGNRKVLHLTDSGNEFCEKWIAPVSKADQSAFSCLNETERNLFLNLTEKQLSCFEEHVMKLLEE